MRCFNHPSYEAAGVCRNCGRGLCRGCITITEEAVACKGKCEVRVAAIQRMIQGNQMHYRTAAGQMRQAGIYSVFAGLLFAAMGGIFVQFVRADFGYYLGLIFIVLGILILVRGISSTWASGKYAQMAVNASDQPPPSGMGHFR